MSADLSDVERMGWIVAEATSLRIRNLYEALKAAETGRNQFGPYWNTAELTAVLHAFYADMETQP